MDLVDARTVLARLLSEWRRKSYQELTADIGHDHHLDVEGAAGVRYQVEIQVMWESEAAATSW